MPSRMRDLIKLTAVIAVAFGLGLTVAQAFDLPRAGAAESSRVIGGAPLVRTAGGGNLRDLPSFADVVDRVNPSVVYVRTSARRRVSQQQRSLMVSIGSKACERRSKMRLRTRNCSRDCRPSS